MNLTQSAGDGIKLPSTLDCCKLYDQRKAIQY